MAAVAAMRDIEIGSMSNAYIGIGANLGDAAAQVRAAMVALDEMPASRLIRASSLYRTAPVGYTAQPDFVNAAALVETALAPRELLAELRGIEQRHGRERSFKNAPRTLDLDLLLYDDRVIADPQLTVPHPRLHKRAFALAPLVEIAPACVVPGHGPARALLEGCADQTVERLPQ